MTLRQWLVLWLWLSSRAPQHGGGSTSNEEALREAETIEVIKMADESAEITKEAAEAVAFTNVKTVGEGPSFYSNMVMANAVSHQQGMQQLQAAIIGKVAEAIIGVSPSEGGADVAALQQLLKGAQTTPPVTG